MEHRTNLRGDSQFMKADMGDRRVDAYRLLVADAFEFAGRVRTTSDGIARPHGQTVARWHLLSVLSEGIWTVSSAARRLGLARQSVQRVANELIAEGFVVSRANPDDARAPRVELTSTGRSCLANLSSLAEADRVDLLAQADLEIAAISAARDVLRTLTATFDQRHRAN